MYGQKDYNDKQGIAPQRYTIAEVGCFLVSFCNLLKRFGKDISPPDLNRLFASRGIWIDVDDNVRDDLGWASITAYDGKIQVAHVNNSGGWPNTNDAILKFKFRSKQTGQVINHFSLVADANARTFIDSWDGKVKNVAQSGYGEPIGWASYSLIRPEVVQPVTSKPPAPVTKPGATYTFVKGDTIWAVAQKLGFTSDELVRHNNIKDVRAIPVGYVLHLPEARPVKKNQSNIRYEILGAPRAMHIKKDGGANKWGFGNVRSWKDFVSVGFYPKNTNVDIVAIAHVPVGKEVAAYYMDAKAFGQYASTGKVAQAIGFNWADVGEGHIAKMAPVPVAPKDPRLITIQPGWGISHAMRERGWPKDLYSAENQWTYIASLNGSNNWQSFNSGLKPGQEIIVPQYEAPKKAPPVAPKAVPLPPPEPVKKPEPIKLEPNAFKATYKAFPAPVVCITKEAMAEVYDHSGRLLPKQIARSTGVEIAGTFEKAGVVYGRPLGAAKADTWFGIPMSNLQAEDELLTLKSDEASQKSGLSLKEQQQAFYEKIKNSFVWLFVKLGNK